MCKSPKHFTLCVHRWVGCCDDCVQAFSRLMRYLVNAETLTVLAGPDGVTPFITRGDWRQGEGACAFTTAWNRFISGHCSACCCWLSFFRRHLSASWAVAVAHSWQSLFLVRRQVGGMYVATSSAVAVWTVVTHRVIAVLCVCPGRANSQSGECHGVFQHPACEHAR